MSLQIVLAAAFVVSAVSCCSAAAPRYAVAPDEKAFVRSLDGEWSFKLEQPGTSESPRKLGKVDPIDTPPRFEPFFSTGYIEDAAWKRLCVPGNWEMAGFSPATYEQPDNSSGFYRKWVEIPASWKGRRVLVNFDAVMCGAEIWLNGEPVPVSEPSWDRPNYHESGWTAWQADLSGRVRFGERNLLALRVTKNTRSSNLDSGDYFFLGGITRRVTLFTVPATHISDLTIVSRLTGPDQAAVDIRVDVAGGPVSVRAALEGADPIEATGASAVELTIPVKSPKLWEAEHPNLYRLTVELLDGSGKTIETVKRRVGIREVSIRDGVFCINGKPVKLRGMCRHEVYAPQGTAVGRDLWRKDLEMMREANVNAVRTSHYPYGSEFYDLCDEMGFYVVDELPYCWTPMDDPSMTPAFEQRARETVRRDKNHACVVIWAIGNENKAGLNQKVAADIVRSMDPTRPRLNSWRNADESGVEFDDRHYTPASRMLEMANDSARRAKWPIIFLENPNVWDVRNGADYGCLDLWWNVLERCWEGVTWQHDSITGGFIWEWQDRTVTDACPLKLYSFDKATGVNYVKTKGLVDGFRSPRPDLYQVKMVYCPIKVGTGAFAPADSPDMLIEIENRYDFTNLSEIDARWTLLSSGKRTGSGKLALDIAPRSKGIGAIQMPRKPFDRIRLEFRHRSGWHIATCDVAAGPASRPPAIKTSPPDELPLPSLNLITRKTSGDPYVWRKVTRTRYNLAQIATVPENATTFSQMRQLQGDIVRQGDTEPSGRLSATYQNGLFSYRVEWSGKVSDVQELGFTFRMPHRFGQFAWERQARWSYYPPDHIGRASGMARPDSAEQHNTRLTRTDAFDFVSTKYDCDRASLTDGDQGLAVAFTPDARHHCKAGFGPDGSYQLIVNRQCSPPDDLSSHQVPDLYMELEPGSVVSGAFYVGSVR